MKTVAEVIGVSRSNLIERMRVKSARHPGQRDCDKNDRSHDCLLGKRSSREERDRNPEPAAEPGPQAMITEKTNGESTPPAITSFSPARSGASSPRK
jgi:hypothetical protein